MRKIFVDTNYLVALVSPRDEMNLRARQARRELGIAKLVVTETVLVETLNYFASYSAAAKVSVVAIVETFLFNPAVEIVEQSSLIFHDGIELYKARLDQGYSLTDCISMSVCRARGIREVLTHDKHFAQEGFEILL